MLPGPKPFSRYHKDSVTLNKLLVLLGGEESADRGVGDHLSGWLPFPVYLPLANIGLGLLCEVYPNPCHTDTR